MDATLDRLVTTDTQSGLIVTRGVPLSSLMSENTSNTSNEEFVLDLSQRSTMETFNSTNHSIVVIDNWFDNSTNTYSDDVSEDLIRMSIVTNNNKFNIEQPLTDQLNHHLIKEDSLSDSSNANQSKFDRYSSMKNIK